MGGCFFGSWQPPTSRVGRLSNVRLYIQVEMNKRRELVTTRLCYTETACCCCLCHCTTSAYASLPPKMSSALPTVISTRPLPAAATHSRSAYNRASKGQSATADSACCQHSGQPSPRSEQHTQHTRQPPSMQLPCNAALAQPQQQPHPALPLLPTTVGSRHSRVCVRRLHRSQVLATTPPAARRACRLSPAACPPHQRHAPGTRHSWRPGLPARPHSG